MKFSGEFNGYIWGENFYLEDIYAFIKVILTEYKRQNKNNSEVNKTQNYGQLRPP